MSIENAVNYMMASRRDSAWLEGVIEKESPSFRDLSDAFEAVFRSRWQTRDLEKATAFTVLYKAIVCKSQTPEFPDPKNGMVRKKIKDINLFVAEYSDSIYSFVKHIEVTNG